MQNKLPEAESLGFSYCRLFDKEPATAMDVEGLVALGNAMTTESALARAPDDSNIPAGYTYLGHLVAHDLTFDLSQGMPDGQVNVDQIFSARRPLLDLGSVYGGGPTSSDERLYQADGVRLRLGPTRGVHRTTWNDLPRHTNGLAIIADERNDENLTTAQMLVALIKFHNAVADFLDRETSVSNASFEDVRKCTLQHFQSIILSDWLWRLVPDSIYHDVMRNGRRLFLPDGLAKGQVPAIPVEFSHAAMRFGHSMVRTSYRWNKRISFAGLDQLFENTARNGGSVYRPLIEDWIIDWRNFFDFSAHAGIERRKEINFSRRITTRITDLLGHLPPGETRHREPANLAVRDLLRGHSLNLPSGQQAVQACYHCHGVYVGHLTPGELCSVGDEATQQTMRKYGLAECTPLWFYILAEAEIEQNGERLGRLGGRLVMEVVHGLIELSDHSILVDKDWQVSLPAHRRDIFTMPDMLAFVGDITGP